MLKVVNFEEMDFIASKLSDKLIENDVIALIGDLGTGKTTFCKTVAKKLGIKENIKSPTFTYVQEYHSGRVKLFHFDVYRIDTASEIYEIGYEDYLNNGGVTIIEWADLIKDELPFQYIEINIFHNDELTRKMDIRVINNKEREKEILDYVGFGN